MALENYKGGQEALLATLAVAALASAGGCDRNPEADEEKAGSGEVEDISCDCRVRADFVVLENAGDLTFVRGDGNEARVAAGAGGTITGAGDTGALDSGCVAEAGNIADVNSDGPFTLRPALRLVGEECEGQMAAIETDPVRQANGVGNLVVSEMGGGSFQIKVVLE